jgi:hypothetical protein
MQTLAFLSLELQSAKHQMDEALAESPQPLVARNENSPDNLETDVFSSVRQPVESAISLRQVVGPASTLTGDGQAVR